MATIFLEVIEVTINVLTSCDTVTFFIKVVPSLSCWVIDKDATSDFPCWCDVASLTIFKDNRICTIAVGRTDTTILVKVISLTINDT